MLRSAQEQLLKKHNQTGAVVYQVAAQWMRAKNGSSHLDETQLYLRPYFEI